ncbi:hypothetical protein [Chitinivorax sp. B]|uniref:hypothetical protein n=1 Tax=Chitinivorax sp. B TaxID=2502235 RepID=UPI0010F53FA6|nr:hypothetical protein [Chitinivorax sp. B]
MTNAVSINISFSNPTIRASGSKPFFQLCPDRAYRMYMRLGHSMQRIGLHAYAAGSYAIAFCIDECDAQPLYRITECLNELEKLAHPRDALHAVFENCRRCEMLHPIFDRAETLLAHMLNPIVVDA